MGRSSIGNEGFRGVCEVDIVMGSMSGIVVWKNYEFLEVLGSDYGSPIAKYFESFQMELSLHLELSKELRT